MSHPNIIVTCLRIFIILITHCIIPSRQEAYNYKVMEIIDDLPSENDLEKYLSALRKIVQFVDGHLFYVNIDLCLEIFVINVYLRSIIQSNADILTLETYNRIGGLIKTIENIIKQFIKMSKVRNEKNEVPNVLIKMLNIQGHKIIWPKITKTFRTDLLNVTQFYSRKSLEIIYFRWAKYKKTVYDYKMGYSILGNCLTLLLENPINNRDKFIYCQVPQNCFEYVKSGKDYGYEIAHRLLIILAARYRHHCVITKNDKRIIDKFCVRMYNELEYMANHEIGLPDLFMNHIALCSFEGHAQFLRRSWIEELLDFQTIFGCFNLKRPSPGSALLVAIFQNVSEKSDKMVWEETCNAHTTGVAGVMLAAAIAYITEVIASTTSA